MPTIIDTQHLYTNLAGNYERQKVAEIPGVNGSQITISKLSFSLQSPTDGLATAWVIAVIDGVEKEIWSVTSDKTEYQPMSSDPAFIVPAGKSVNLEWWLRSSRSTYKARMQLVSYTYDYVKEEEPEPEIKNCIMIICSSAEDVENMAEDLKAHVGDRKVIKLIET